MGTRAAYSASASGLCLTSASKAVLEEEGPMGHEYSKTWRMVSVAILRPLLFLLLKRDWRGRKNIPRDGGVIVAANHLSWSDPLAVAHYVYKSGRYPVYLAKDALFGVKVLGPILR